MALDPRYRLEDAAQIFTPAVVVYPELIRSNLDKVVRTVPSPAQLRPHVKTHKTIELTQLELAAGITKHKCATIAEAELLARAGVTDIVIAYPLVGPNIQRLLRLQEHYPDCSFKPLVDHPAPLAALGQALIAVGRTAEVLLDLNVGMGRTGILPGAEARSLYQQIQATAGVTAGGLHVYDGHNHQESLRERSAAVETLWAPVAKLIADLEASGASIPRIVCGGTPTFPIWAELARRDARIECSPGTFFVNDWNYHRWFEDLPMQPAAVLLTRVISKPGPNRLTLDLGSKAVASDSAVERRAFLLNVPGAVLIKQSEEHLVVETPSAADFAPGDLVYAWPAHICPTCALHRELLVAENHRITGAWKVLARDRMLDC